MWYKCLQICAIAFNRFVCVDREILHFRPYFFIICNVFFGGHIPELKFRLIRTKFFKYAWISRIDPYITYEKEDKKFSLNTQPLLHWLKEFHGCDIIYRHILTKEDLQYYLKYFATHKRETKGYDINYTIT